MKCSTLQLWSFVLHTDIRLTHLETSVVYQHEVRMHFIPAGKGERLHVKGRKNAVLHTGKLLPGILEYLDNI